jgi:uronate dehydrogenase
MIGAVSRLLVTGAAGRIGTSLRPALREDLEELRLSDIAPLDELAPQERFVRADIADLAALCAAAAGIDAIVHLGAVSTEASFTELVGPNLVGAFNAFEAARLEGVRRVVFASSNHATGFYPSDERISVADAVRPDGLYGVTKAYGEALGRMYADRFGLEVVCLRIGTWIDRPTEVRHLSTWLSPADGARLVRAALAAPVDFAVVYGVSANTRSYWDNSGAARLGYEPEDDAERFAAEVGGHEFPHQGGGYAAPGHGGWA